MLRLFATNRNVALTSTNGRKKIDYILTRQANLLRVHHAKVVSQPPATS